MYSNDRKTQLERTISCLSDMPYYDQCQKVLVVDGNITTYFQDFDVINVPRMDGKFNWSNMWAAGVGVARFPIVWYLDSDRLLPANYTQLILDNIAEDVFLFTSRHFMVKSNLSLELCKEYLNDDNRDNLHFDSRYIGSLEFEPRYQRPLSGPGKGVMSGNTAFTKSTFLRLGGVDPWYHGHGAYADTDFHEQAERGGCQFIDMESPELHYHHDKMDREVILDEMTLRRMGLDNFIYYCVKWGVPLHYAENLAFECNVIKPKRYVEDKAKSISMGS